MKLRVHEQDRVTVFALTGDFAGDASDQFRRAGVEHLDNASRDFVVDLSNVQTIDSRGLETLIWLEECATERLGQVRLAALNETLQQVLRLTRLEDRLPADKSVDEAVVRLQMVTQ